MNDPDSKKEIANSCDSKSSDSATTDLNIKNNSFKLPVKLTLKFIFINFPFLVRAL